MKIALKIHMEMVFPFLCSILETSDLLNIFIRKQMKELLLWSCKIQQIEATDQTAGAAKSNQTQGTFHP